MIRSEPPRSISACITTVSTPSGCALFKCACCGELQPGALSSFRARKSTEALFMFKVICAAAARPFWLCNLVSALRFALIWQMLEQTRFCSIMSCLCLIWSLEIHCIDGRLCCHGDTVEWGSMSRRVSATFGSIFCAYVRLCQCPSLLNDNLHQNYLPRGLWRPDSTIAAQAASLTRHYPSCPDDTAEPQVSSGWAGIESLPVETGGSGS